MLKIFFFRFCFLFLILVLQAISVEAKTRNFIFLGDSLTEGYGVAQTAAFPFLIQEKAKANQLDWNISSSGSSGSTSASTLSRLKWIAKKKPDYVMLIMGSNDGLRGLKTEELEKNLAEAISWAQKNKLKIILGELLIPPNYGLEYTKKFKNLYPALAKKFNIPLGPFLLDGVAGQPSLNQADGIHPNEKGHQIIAEKMFQYLLPILKK